MTNEWTPLAVVYGSYLYVETYVILNMLNKYSSTVIILLSPVLW